MLLQPGTPGPGGLKLSSDGNWKGRETGTRPPSIPKPRGRGGVTEPKRLLPDAVDPWRRRASCEIKHYQTVNCRGSTAYL